MTRSSELLSRGSNCGMRANVRSGACALSDGDLALWPGRSATCVTCAARRERRGQVDAREDSAGVHQPDSGEMLVDGSPRRFATPAEARDAGLAVIYQEPTLFFDLSIAENIFMGRQPVDRIGRIQLTRCAAKWMACSRRSASRSACRSTRCAGCRLRISR